MLYLFAMLEQSSALLKGEKIKNYFRDFAKSTTPEIRPESGNLEEIRNSENSENPNFAASAVRSPHDHPEECAVTEFRLRPLATAA